MAKVKFVGAAQRRVIRGTDLQRHGLTSVDIDLRQGEVADLPDDVADWLLSKLSKEREWWTRVDDQGQEVPQEDVIVMDTTSAVSDDADSSIDISSSPSAPEGGRKRREG